MDALAEAITIKIEPRDDGGIRVSSDELPGLILSGKHADTIMASILPAVRGLREYAAKEAEDKMAKQAADAKWAEDGWVKWSGGGCPVPPHALVQFRTASELDRPQTSISEDEGGRRADTLRWEWTKSSIRGSIGDDDIAAYRVMSIPADVVAA